MHASLSSLKYKPPFFMFYHHRVLLFAIQCLFFFDALAHSCASLPLRYKWNAHLGFFAMITTFDVY